MILPVILRSVDKNYQNKKFYYELNLIYTGEATKEIFDYIASNNFYLTDKEYSEDTIILQKKIDELERTIKELEFKNKEKEMQNEKSIINITKKEYNNVLEANVKLMNKYKETFDDIKYLIDFLDGDVSKRDNAYKVIQDYRNKKMFKEDYEE